MLYNNLTNSDNIKMSDFLKVVCIFEWLSTIYGVTLKTNYIIRKFF